MEQKVVIVYKLWCSEPWHREVWFEVSNVDEVTADGFSSTIVSMCGSPKYSEDKNGLPPRNSKWLGATAVWASVGGACTIASLRHAMYRSHLHWGGSTKSRNNNFLPHFVSILLWDIPWAPQLSRQMQAVLRDMIKGTFVLTAAKYVTHHRQYKHLKQYKYQWPEVFYLPVGSVVFLLMKPTLTTGRPRVKFSLSKPWRHVVGAEVCGSTHS